MNLTIKLVRHGESEANVGLVKGWEVGDHSIALTPEGHRQSCAAGELIGRGFLSGAIAYSSPFRRARETLDALLVGAHLERSEIRIFEDPRLREVEHGYVSVESQRALQTKHGPFFYRFAGGESPADCYDRTSGFLESMMRQATRSDVERVLIVTHGLTIRCFVMRFLHLTVEQFEAVANPTNCAIITIGPRAAIREPAFTTTRWAVNGLQVRDTVTGVSRETARTIARAEIVARRLGTDVSDVQTIEEVSHEPSMYNGPDLTRCWIAYAKRSDDNHRPKASTIVLIDRQTGAVLYAGSANDEG